MCMEIGSIGVVIEVGRVGGEGRRIVMVKFKKREGKAWVIWQR